MRIFTILFALSLFTLTSCDEQDIAGSYDIVMVGDNDYSVHDITLTIEMGEVNNISGKSTCNQYSGPFKNLGKGKVKIGTLIGTKMYCKDVAKIESDYMKKLGMVTEVKLTKNGLELLGINGNTLITAVKQ